MGLLIVVGHYFCFLTNKGIKKSCGPVACKTVLGWVFSGPLSSKHSFSSCLTTHSMRCTVKRTLEEDDRFWEIEIVKPFDECVINQLEKDI